MFSCCTYLDDGFLLDDPAYELAPAYWLLDVLPAAAVVLRLLFRLFLLKCLGWRHPDDPS